MSPVPQAFLETLAIAAPVLIVGGLGAYLGFGFWRGLRSGERPLLLGEMLLRNGVSPAGVQSHAEALHLAEAARRCFACSAQAGCRGWLESKDTEGYREFCPNADFIDAEKARKTA